MYMCMYIFTICQVRGRVDIVLFEGWRVGVAHPNFFPFNRVVDTLMFLDVDFDTILQTKFECVQRDIAQCGFDMYEQHGGYAHVFEHHYRRMYYEWIEPVRDLVDVVIAKGSDHQISAMTLHPLRCVCVCVCNVCVCVCLICVCL